MALQRSDEFMLTSSAKVELETSNNIQFVRADDGKV